MADGVENDSCRIDGVPPPRSRLINRRSIWRTFQNYLGECAWAETHLGETCDILLKEIKRQWGSEYENAAL